MHTKFIAKLIFIVTLMYTVTILADNDQIIYVSVSDPIVISAANFAVQEIDRGSLFEILSAQKQGEEDVMYILTLELVDAHIKHHNYIVEVLVPADQKPWQVTYFSEINY